MPRIRPRTVVDEEYVEQASYTINLDLPESGLVSDLYLIVHARAHPTADGRNKWIRNLITSVSVNQAGQEALNAAPPDFFQADYYYKTGKYPQCGARRWETFGDIEEVVPILFGNKEKDLEHYIDLSRLSDPKLSVTYNLAGTDKLGYNIWLTTRYPRFSIIANLIEGVDVPVSKGYHSLRQIEKYTASDSQIKKIELKGGRPIKRILFQYDIKNLNYVMRQHVDKIRLWGDNEAWVPFSMTSERFKNFVRMIHGLCKVKGNFEQWGYNDAINCIVDEREYLAINQYSDRLAHIFCMGGSGRAFMFQATTLGTGAEYVTDTSGYFEFVGIAPNAIYPISMPEMLGMDYLDPEEHKPVYFELEHASDAATTTGGDMRIAVSDLVKQR